MDQLDSAGLRGGDPPGLPWGEFRSAVEEEFARRGVGAAPAEQATVLVEVGLSVELKTRHNDPYYDLYVGEQYEEGTLTITLFDRATGDEVWTGECRHRLRYVARSMGGMASEPWIQTGEERAWHAEELVAKILDRLST